MKDDFNLDTFYKSLIPTKRAIFKATLMEEMDITSRLFSKWLQNARKNDNSGIPENKKGLFKLVIRKRQSLKETIALIEKMKAANIPCEEQEMLGENFWNLVNTTAN